MSPIPGEPLHRTPTELAELTTKDGRKVKVKFPGLAPRATPVGTEERGAAQPPRDNPAPAHNPYHAPL
ncbi:MAG TPA: hypothetical protein VHZ75_05505 [Solirubrobacteraceae bacterium]|jgi:hypothetical protein|nr:hypothetical protein [Solirubrobacteraceae bacterium]